MSLVDITTIEREAKEELAKELGAVAKAKIKASLRTIALAEKALHNARNEHSVLMHDIAIDGPEEG